MLRPEVERMRMLLDQAITTLCRSGLQYKTNLKVEGLIGITLDEEDVILVNLNRSFKTQNEQDHTSDAGTHRSELVQKL